MSEAKRPLWGGQLVKQVADFLHLLKAARCGAACGIVPSMSFAPDAKLRNGLRLAEAARLCLAAALDGGIVITGYETWTQAVADDLAPLVAKHNADFRLPCYPYDEDG